PKTEPATDLAGVVAAKEAIVAPDEAELAGAPESAEAAETAPEFPAEAPAEQAEPGSGER
ncbi:MAG: hypothetical protein M3138_04625, partial [Actinomycetota bacterium]|nr:hypothetical protein [Actinomycetota bacterium]